MRFENSALKRFGIEPHDLDDFRRAGEAAYDANRSRRDAGQLSEKPGNCSIGLAIHRGRGHVKFPGLTQLPREFCLACPSANLKRESGFHPGAFLVQPSCAIQFAPEDQ